jgi:hypothetical protein
LRSISAFACVAAICGISWVAVGGQPAEPQSGTSPPAPSEPAPEIPFASPHAAAVTTPSAPTAWGGPRSGQEATLSDRVVRYQIAATLDPEHHTVDGREQLSWRNRSDRPIHAIYLHLYLNAFEGPGSTFITEERNHGFGFRSEVRIKDGEWGHIELKRVQQNGAAVPWQFVHPDGGPETDHTVVRFDLPTAVAPGGSTTIDIDFHDRLPRVVARTGYFGSFHLVGQWFPKIGVLELPGERGASTPRWNVHEFHLLSEFYADFGEYDVQLTVPSGFVVGAVGEEQGEPVEKDGQVTHHFVQGDVHDFAWSAGEDWAAPLVGSYDGPGSPHVTVRVLYPREYQASAQPALQASLDALRYFSQKLGPYPYRTLTCVVPPYNAREAGGMEYPTFFTTEGFSSVPHDSLVEAILQFVTIHEFGHGYFYGLLASNEFEEPMLDEGLNEYWDMRMTRDLGEHMVAPTPLLNTLGIKLHIGGFQYERATGAFEPHPPDALGQNAWDRLSTSSYGSVYRRTATLMHDLEERLGRAATERAFAAYYERWHFRHPSIADLRETLAEVSGDRRTVEEVFAQQVLAVNPIDNRVQEIASAEELPLPGTYLRDGKWVEETEKEVKKNIREKRAEWAKGHPNANPGDPGPFPFRTTVIVRRDGAPWPETLLVKFEDGSTRSVRWDPSENEHWHRYFWITPSRAVSADLDPERQYYLDINKLNDGRTIKGNGVAARRWTSDAAAFLQGLFALVVSL